MKKLIAALLSIVSFAANADLSLVAGMGRADFKWCGIEGCWRQNPLPYEDNRSGEAAILGIRFGATKNLDIDLLYHALPNAYVSGLFVPDEYYNPQTGEIDNEMPINRYYKTKMVASTNGVSLSVVPKANYGDTSVFGRIGALRYTQKTEFTHVGETAPYFIDSGTSWSWMIGAGVGHTFGNITIAAEVVGFNLVKYGQSPVGGNWKDDKSQFGLVEYLLTISYKL